MKRKRRSPWWTHRLVPVFAKFVFGLLIGIIGWFLRDIYETNRRDHTALQERDLNLGERTAALESQVFWGKK